MKVAFGESSVVFVVMMTAKENNNNNICLASGGIFFIKLPVLFNVVECESGRKQNLKKNYMSSCHNPLTGRPAIFNL